MEHEGYWHLFECEQVGDLLHMFWSCPEVMLFWKYIERYIRRCSNQNFILNIQYVVYGMLEIEKEDIHLILNYALFSIYKCINIGIAYTKKDEIYWFKNDVYLCSKRSIWWWKIQAKRKCLYEVVKMEQHVK